MKKTFSLKKFVVLLLLIFISVIGTLLYIGDKNNDGERNAIYLLKDKMENEQKEPTNLIICWTPLQMLIAERIIALNPNEKFYTIVMSHTEKNEKFEHYANILAQKSERFYSFYIHPQSQNQLFVYTTLLELKLKSLLLPEMKTIYFAHISSPEVHTLISSFPKAQLKTFDDGSANLVKKSAFLNDAERISTGEISKVFYETFINTTHSTKEVREKSVEHYTIFKDMPNIMEDGKRKITYLPLFDISQLNPKKPTKDTIKIMLGTAEKKLKITTEKAVEHFGITYMIPHPRQNYELNNAKTIKSPLVIEDYLLQEIAKNPYTQYEVYTFFSGAALTLKDFPNVTVYSIKPTSFPKNYWLSPVYDLLQEAKVPVLEFKDK